MEHFINFPHIPPRDKKEKHPLWSVMIPCYQNLHYLEATVNSVLIQDPGKSHMQIALYCDPSAEENFDTAIKNLPLDRIEIVKHINHVGHNKNFNACIRGARGHIVHILHGDDQVRPGYYEKLTKVFNDHPEVDAAFTRFIYVDKDNHWRALSGIERSSAGILAQFLEQIAVRNFLISSSIAVKRHVYEKVGGFCEHIPSYEDWEMWKRIGLVSRVWYDPEPLCLYRKHSGSLALYNMEHVHNIDGMELAIELSRYYFPESHVQKWTAQARRIAAQFAMKQSRLLLRRKQFRLSVQYVYRALKLNQRPEMGILLYRYIKDTIRYFPSHFIRST